MGLLKRGSLLRILEQSQYTKPNNLDRRIYKLGFSFVLVGYLYFYENDYHMVSENYVPQSPRWIGARRNDCIAENGLVSSKHPLIGEAGIKIMKNGGNAVDAAVSAAFSWSVSLRILLTSLPPCGLGTCLHLSSRCNLGLLVLL